MQTRRLRCTLRLRARTCVEEDPLSSPNRELRYTVLDPLSQNCLQERKTGGPEVDLKAKSIIFFCTLQMVETLDVVHVTKTTKTTALTPLTLNFYWCTGLGDKIKELNL